MDNRNLMRKMIAFNRKNRKMIINRLLKWRIIFQTHTIIKIPNLNKVILTTNNNFSSLFQLPNESNNTKINN